jgi:hypothetical protein
VLVNVKKVKQTLGPNLVGSRMQSNIVMHAYKRIYTTSFALPSQFTRAIKELREIKDDLSPSHLEQSINTPRSQNSQTTT